MKLARLFLAVLAVGALAACNDTVTAPDTKATDVPASQTVTCEGTWVTGDDGVPRCTGQIGSGG